MSRLIVSTQLEQAAGPDYILQADTNGDLQFVLASTVVQGEETVLVVTTDGDGTGVSHSGTNDHTVDIILLSADVGNDLSTGADGGIFAQLKVQDVVADITARDALTGELTGDIVFVTDASADATVNSGWAVYLWDGSAWVKIAEEESLDETVYSWTIDDGSSSQQINSGDTLTITQDEGVVADVSSTDILTIGLRRVEETFAVSSADVDTVTISGTLPSDETLIDVYRNGVASPASDWSLSGQDLTFTDGFGGSDNGTDAEDILVKYFEG